VSIDKPLPVSVLAVALSSLAFGFLHGAWFAGTVAGLLYAFVRYRTGHVGYAIFAHSSTNALLCVAAFDRFMLLLFSSIGIRIILG